MGKAMTKSQIADHLAKKADVTKKIASQKCVCGTWNWQVGPCTPKSQNGQKSPNWSCD